MMYVHDEIAPGQTSDAEAVFVVVYSRIMIPFAPTATETPEAELDKALPRIEEIARGAAETEPWDVDSARIGIDAEGLAQKEIVKLTGRAGAPVVAMDTD